MDQYNYKPYDESEDMEWDIDRYPIRDRNQSYNDGNRYREQPYFGQKDFRYPYGYEEDYQEEGWANPYRNNHFKPNVGRRMGNQPYEENRSCRPNDNRAYPWMEEESMFDLERLRSWSGQGINNQSYPTYDVEALIDESYLDNYWEQHDIIEEVLQLVCEVVANESKDEILYNQLIDLSPSKEQKAIIHGIRDDERKKYNLLREIYAAMTGEPIEVRPNEEAEIIDSYMEGISQALMGKVKAMEKYRDIRSALPTRYFRDMIFEILTDELEHADRYNYLITINK